MTGWALFWYIVIAAAVVSYFGLALVVSIGAFFDVKKMFRRLDDAHRVGTTSSAPPRADNSSAP